MHSENRASRKTSSTLTPRQGSRIAELPRHHCLSICQDRCGIGSPIYPLSNSQDLATSNRFGPQIQSMNPEQFVLTQ
ncbi:hypothetical protein EJ03DRAFT_329597 [Teratosphaeria nubilosa]|uniref:Uncharacterized protein n=1 Tax=Teratosphaeria nubilosa TaxID=161662 RepID=A0A6G1L2J1_9PEZI|nr:hypothetical protein EJ03DRAFT_329597 [Teratosphaeria nubilosa]